MSNLPTPNDSGNEARHQAEIASAGLPALLVEAKRIAQTVAQGVHGRRRVGQGESFWQFRRYQPGDSSQQIDWRQSARSKPLYVRETEWEAAQSVWLWRDLSPSMIYRSTETLPAKFERRDVLLLALASVLNRGGERFALAGAGTRPLSGPTALERLWSLMKNQQPYQTELLISEIPKHAHVVMFGDFLSPLDEIKNTMAMCAARNVRGHLVRIIDPAEEAFPFDGRIEFNDTESSDAFLIGRSELVRDTYKQAFEGHGLGLAELARAWGWSLTSHHTSQPAAPTLLSLYMSLSLRNEV